MSTLFKYRVRYSNGRTSDRFATRDDAYAHIDEIGDRNAYVESRDETDHWYAIVSKEVREQGKNPRKSHRSKRGKNPRLQNMFMLLATKGKTVLKYTGGIRFSSKGRAVLFPSRHDAETAARDLRSRFPVLKGYTLHVRS